MTLLKTPRSIAVVTVAAGIMVAAAACNRTEPAKDVGSAAAPPATATPTAEPRSDAQISTAVQARYYGDDAIRGRDIEVEAQNGTVTLRGTVGDEAAKERAGTLARGVDGVTTVVNDLAVREDSTATTARTSEPGSAGEIGTAGREDTRQPGWITTKIQAQYFVNPDIKPWNIDVTTASGGVVTLEGTVESEQHKTEAVRVARATDGVTRVEDRLRVEADAGRDRGSADTAAARGVEQPDTWVTAKIQAKYFVDADVKGRRIGVDTRDGVVTLTGATGSEAERRQAVALARNTDGVRDVKDELRVDVSLRDRDADAGAGDRRQSPTGPQRPDVWVTTKIQAQYFLDPVVKGRRIDVDTSRGVVTLKGSVDSEQQKQTAEQIARETEGVTRVLNQLTVGPGGA